MVNLPDQALWVWILMGATAGVSAWWANVRPGTHLRRLFAPAVGAAIIFLLVLALRGVALGDLPLLF